jgi:hypothetical protein
MPAEITDLGSPIGAIYLIHKALRAEAAHAERLAFDLNPGDSLQRFRLAFNSWATALVSHAELEDKYLATPLAGLTTPTRFGYGHGVEGNNSPATTASPPVADAPELPKSVFTTMMAMEDEAHNELVEAAQAVLTVLDQEIGKTSPIPRTIQHLHRQVVALCIAQEDHLETEEALILPAIRERVSEQQQLQMAKGLLIDERAQDTRWIIDWMAPHLTLGEHELLAGLEKRLKELPTLASVAKGV